MVRRVLPQGVKLRIVRHEAGIHRHEFDAPQTQLLMPDAQLALPTILRGIDRQKANQPVAGLGRVVGNIAVIDPQAAPLGFAPEDDRFHVGGRRGAVLRQANGEVHFSTGASASPGGEILR